MGPRKRASTPSGERSTSHRRRRPDQPLRIFDEADLDAALAGSTSSAVRRRGWRTRQAEQNERYRTYFAARDWNAMAAILADDVVTDDRRRVVNAGVRQAEMPKSRTCETLADIGDRQHYDVDRHRDPRAAPRPQSSPRLGPPSSRPKRSTSSRSMPTSGSSARRVRRRRHRRRLRGTRRPVPRRRSGRPRAHMVGHRRGLHRVQPARTSRNDTDWVNIDHRRAHNDRAGDMAASIRAALDSCRDLSIYIEAVHRLTDLGAVVTHVAHGDLARGLRRRVADDRHLYGRRRPDQPLRAIRRGRPRCCARQVRRAQSSGAAAGKRGKPSGRALSGALRGPRLGRHGRDTGRRLFERRSSSGR